MNCIESADIQSNTTIMLPLIFDYMQVTIVGKIRDSRR